MVVVMKMLECVSGSLYTLQDARPALGTSMGGETKELEWWTGGPAFMLASAGAVRLNFRGVHVYPPSALVRQLGGQDGIGWSSTPCNASAWALCNSEMGSVLPWSQPRMPESPETVPEKWGSLRCKDGHGKVLVSLGVYDISACDVIDEGVDLVYSRGSVSHRHTSMPLWRYWTCVGLAIVLVRALSYNVQGLWKKDARGDETGHRQWPALVGSVCILGLVLSDLDAVYITKADQVFFWASVAYVGFYLAVHGARRQRMKSHEEPVFNVIVGTLQVLAVRLYTAAETPYNLVLLGMLACRGWTKLMTPSHTQRYGLSLVMDSLYLSLCIELAFNGSRELVVGVLGVAFVAARLLV